MHEGSHKLQALFSCSGADSLGKFFEHIMFQAFRRKDGFEVLIGVVDGMSDNENQQSPEFSLVPLPLGLSVAIFDLTSSFLELLLREIGGCKDKTLDLS
jgi:hypothetical protein